MANTILVKGRGIRKEAKAHLAITPGMLIQLNSDGEIQPHAQADGNHAKAFAVEDELHGKEITENYAANANCVYEVMPPGAEVMALVADGTALTRGGYLSSAGGGLLKQLAATTADASSTAAAAPLTTQISPIVGIALETRAAGSGSANVHVLIEVV